MAQTGGDPASVDLSDLPSAKAPPKLPDSIEPLPGSDFIEGQLPESPSIPRLRPAEKEADKAKEQDWAAQAMLQKKEEAKKKEQEQAAQAEQKSRETQLALEKEKKEKEKQTQANSANQPTVAKSATPGFGDAEAQKLPVVTGLDGVKPRGMASGDGRVQPGFDSFTGPSSTGPLGKDYQSGARPIMPGSASADGRMQVVPQAPEPPSGGYKRISQDPYSLPPGYGEKKPVAAPVPPKAVAILPNPPTGSPKRVIDDSKAGYAPYDNSKKVPDPRSQRRF